MLRNRLRLPQLARPKPNSAPAGLAERIWALDNLRQAWRRVRANVLAVARPMIQGKLLNQRLVLQRRIEGVDEGGQSLALAPAAAPAVQKAAQGIGRLLDPATRASTIDTLRGYEGKAGAFYFGALRQLLPAELGFQGRAFYPPPDPANAALSFGYTYLRGAVEGAVQTVGLDPYLGFFHTPHHNQPALALDLMEEFRPLVVDVIVLRAFGQRVLTAADFRTAGPKCWLEGPAARDRFTALYEERLNTPVTYHLTGQQNTYRNCILLQAQHLARVIAGEDKVYQPLTMR